MISFDTEQKRQDAIASFTNLQNQDGWKLVVEIINANIEIIREQLEAGSEDENMDYIKRLRGNLAILKEMRDTPQNMLEKLQSPDTEPDNPDPFETLQDVRERKKRAVDKEQE